MTRHKCFISYHHADERKVTEFVDKFGATGGTFIRRHLDIAEDIIDSNDTDYVMRRIRELYLTDSTVTIILIGKCTWARRFVDWEVQSSLRLTSGSPPNGLVAIQLWDSYNHLPYRVQSNVSSGYANFYKWPSSSESLERMIQRAFDARTQKAAQIENPRDHYKYNRTC